MYDNESSSPTERPFLLPLCLRRKGRISIQPQPKNCEQKRALLAEHLRLTREAESAAKDYREVITIGMGGPARDAMRSKVQSSKAQAEKARADYENHRREHGC